MSTRCVDALCTRGVATVPVWPADPYAARWADVAGSGFEAATIDGVRHDELMVHAKMIDAVLKELAELLAKNPGAFAPASAA